MCGGETRLWFLLIVVARGMRKKVKVFKKIKLTNLEVTDVYATRDGRRKMTDRGLWLFQFCGHFGGVSGGRR